MTADRQYERDLVVLVPDSTFRSVVSTLLSRRHSLGIRRVSYDVYSHPYHDPGCARQSGRFLSPFLPTHSKAIVLFDRDGSGLEPAEAPEIERIVQNQLDRSGWADRSMPVVVDPELEVWGWSDSPQVDRCLGWGERRPAIRAWLRARGLWEPLQPKPTDPKAAMKLILRETRGGALPPVLTELARTVGLRRCVDPAFQRFSGVLREWFADG